jgi:hypothetical protein
MDPFKLRRRGEVSRRDETGNDPGISDVLAYLGLVAAKNEFRGRRKGVQLIHSLCIDFACEDDFEALILQI